MVTTRLLILGVGLGLVAAPAVAGKRAKKPRKAMVFVTEKGASEKIVAAVEAFCVKAEAFYGVGVWQKKKVKKKVAKCADSNKCLVKLAKKKKLTHLVVGRAHPIESVVRFAFQTIDVTGQKVTAESELTIASVEEAQAAMARAYFRIAGITMPGYVAIADAPAAVNVDGREVEVKDGKLELLPGPHTLRVNDEEQDVMVLPRETREVKFASLAPPPPPPPPAEPVVEPTESTPVEVAVAPPVAAAASEDEDDLVATLPDEPAVSETEPSSGGLGLLSWVGIGAAGTGVVLLGVGGVFGAQASVDLSADTTQLEAHELNVDARSNATLANAMMISGGVLVIAGATMLALDLLAEPSVAVSAAPMADGAALIVGGSW